VARTVRFDVLATAKAVGFEEADRKIERLSGTAKKSTSGLLVAAAALAPALVPIAAAATAASLSFVAMGAVGLLAFQGIKKEMAAGTPIGKQYAASLGVLKGDLAELERTAAGGVLTGFQSSVRSLQPLMPLVNADVGKLSAKLGDIASHVMPGLVALFHTANPLFLGFADDIDKGAAAFERWATASDGATKFVAYAQAQLPKVEQFIATLVTTVGHLAQGFAPLGGFILTDLTAFSKLINAIPIPVLKVAAPLVLALVVAMKAMAVASLIAPKIALLTGSIKGLAYANAIAGGSSMTALLGGLGKLSAVAVVATAGIYGASQVAQDKLGPAAGRAAEIADEALKLVAGSVHQTTDQVKAGVSGTDAAFQAYLGTLGNISKFSREHLTTLHDELGKATVATSDFGYATGTLAGSQVQAGYVIDGVTTAIDKQTTAASLLRDALDRLNGSSLSVEDTQNSFLDTLGRLKTASDIGTASISQNSTASRKNREILVQAIHDANDHAQAIANQTAKTKGLNAGVTAGVADFKAHEDAIKRAARAAGLDTDQVAALIAKLGKVPKNVVAAVSIRDKATSQIATIKANLAALKSKQIDITTYVRNVILPTLGKFSVTHDSHRALGGPVTAGQSYIVGENRPEVFTPSSNGYINPRVPTGGNTINVYLPGLYGGADGGRAVAAVLEKFVGEGGTLNIARGVRA
jgi:hypothetical protein